MIIQFFIIILINIVLISACHNKKREGHFTDLHWKITKTEKVFIFRSDTFNFKLEQGRSKLLLQQMPFIVGKENLSLIDTSFSSVLPNRKRVYSSYSVLFDSLALNNIESDTLNINKAFGISRYSILPNRTLWFEFFLNKDSQFIKIDSLCCQTTGIACITQRTLFWHYGGKGKGREIIISPDTFNKVYRKNIPDSLYIKIERMYKQLPEDIGE